MKKWKKILIWALSVVIVVGISGVFAANYMIDKLMNSMANSFEDENTVLVENTQGESTKPIVGSETSKEVVQSVPSSETNGSEDKEEHSISPSSTPGTVNDKPVASPEANTETITKVNNASEDQSVINDEKNKETTGYTSQVSSEKAKEIQENVTVKDKTDVASIVLGQLSVSDIKRLQELAAGGLSTDEKREARSIILGKVSEEQYNELSQIAKKYGVSQGKTRDQILAEEQEEMNKQEKGSE